ncbi:ankyrin repeat domain-containing protein [Wolbachia endosymbiont (group B) of Nymphalis c-album]|uniref:ankyrin repeat domain-containing protein n=1 Tax=Wolbachia endosymbiont (group B) of Nymphalis c-album TaxID=2954034 RepID=UPI0038732059
MDARNKKGFTFLHLAVRMGHLDIVKFLVKDCEFDVNAKSKEDVTPLHFAAKNGHVDIVKLLLKNKADVNVKTKEGSTPLLFALDCRHFEVADLLLADPNINVGSIKAASINKENKEGKEKFYQKLRQDYNLFQKVKEASNEKDKGKLDELLVEIEELLESKNKHGFKPSLNYSPDGNNENTTIEIAIQAGGKLLDLLYAYAKKNIGTDTEIFKRLKHAKENSQSKRDLCDVSVLKHSTPDQGFLFSNG